MPSVNMYFPFKYLIVIVIFKNLNEANSSKILPIKILCYTLYHYLMAIQLCAYVAIKQLAKVIATYTKATILTETSFIVFSNLV